MNVFAEIYGRARPVYWGSLLVTLIGTLVLVVVS